MAVLARPRNIHQEPGRQSETSGLEPGTAALHLFEGLSLFYAGGVISDLLQAIGLQLCE